MLESFVGIALIVLFTVVLLDLAIVAVKRFIVKLNKKQQKGREEVYSSADHFPIWRSVELGIHKSVDELRNALEGANCHVSSWADDILESPTFILSQGAMMVDLAMVSIATLGFKKRKVSLMDVYRRAQELGLALCHAEVGPQLRLQYLDQPEGEGLAIAMEPLATYSHGTLSLFCVDCSFNDYEGLWLDADPGRLTKAIGRDYRLIFAVPRKNHDRVRDRLAQRLTGAYP